MNVGLNRLLGQNFKGLDFEINPNGKDIIISGENKVGKTRTNDAYSWLITGKDALGRKDYKLHPMDGYGVAKSKRIVVVEGDLSFDGTVHTLRKENHERRIKGKLDGYETLCWIDGVKKLLSKYNAWIAERVDIDRLKLVTDLSYFNEKLKWKERRIALLGIADEVGEPDGFDELTELRKGRSIDDMKQVLSDEKKGYNKKIGEIEPKIEENELMLRDYRAINATTALTERDNANNKIAELDEKRSTLLKSEQSRQVNIDEINDLKSKRVARESELLNDRSAVQQYLDERADIDKGVADKKQAVTDIENALTLNRNEITAATQLREVHKETFNSIVNEHNEAEKAPIDGVCGACGLPLEADKLQVIEQARKDKLAEIAERGKAQRKVLNDCKSRVEAETAKTAQLNEKLGKAGVEFTEAANYRKQRLAQLNALISSNQTTEPCDDPAWCELSELIDHKAEELGEPVGDQIETIENDRKIYADQVKTLDKTLANVDSIAKLNARIADLEESNKDLAQKVADVERFEAMICDYIAAESAMIEESVNKLFQHVKFTLFKPLLNGEINEDCVATLEGRPYGTMSYGEKRFASLDIINTFAEYHDICMPIFIDNAVSLTLPMDTGSQVIRLCAIKGVKALTVEEA